MYYGQPTPRQYDPSLVTAKVVLIGGPSDNLAAPGVSPSYKVLKFQHLHCAILFEATNIFDHTHNFRMWTDYPRFFQT